jgi:hypothetical protein
LHRSVGHDRLRGQPRRLQWTATSEIQSFVNGSATNNGWRSSDTAEGSLTTRTGAFTSSEGGNGPSADITYYP